VDEIYCIYENDNLLYDAGPLGGEVTIDDAVDGKVSLLIENRGTIDFYFGTDDQAANSRIAVATGYSLPLPGLCYAVFNDFMIGENQNRVGAMKFVIRKSPVKSSEGNEVIGDFDYNGACAIEHVLIDILGLDEETVDTDIIGDVAETLATEEMGISVCCTQDGTVLDYLESIFSHIRGCLYVTEDGKLAPRLFRADVDMGDMITIDEDDILEEADISRKSLIDTNNEIHSSYSRLISN
jgi:hypothetical protein